MQDIDIAIKLSHCSELVRKWLKQPKDETILEMAELLRIPIPDKLKQPKGSAYEVVLDA